MNESEEFVLSNPEHFDTVLDMLGSGSSQIRNRAATLLYKECCKRSGLDVSVYTKAPIRQMIEEHAMRRRNARILSQNVYSDQEIDSIYRMIRDAANVETKLGGVIETVAPIADLCKGCLAIHSYLTKKNWFGLADDKREFCQDWEKGADEDMVIRIQGKMRACCIQARDRFVSYRDRGNVSDGIRTEIAL